MSLYVDNPASSTASVGWLADCSAWALSRSGLSGLNRFASTDLMDGDFVLGSTSATPASVSGGVYNVPPSANTSSIDLGKVAGNIIVGSMKAEIWAMRARVKLSAATFTSAKFIVPINLYNGTEDIYVISVPATSTTVFQLSLFSSGADHLNSCGTVGTLGSTTCPVGAFFTVGVYFDLTTLTVDFNGTVALQLTGSGLDNMGVGAGGVQCIANDFTNKMTVDGLFAACVAAT